MTENRPCRFCAIAVTLATRICIRLRARWVGGLSSAAIKATVGRSLPLRYYLAFSGDKHSASLTASLLRMTFLHHNRQTINFGALLTVTELHVRSGIAAHPASGIVVPSSDRLLNKVHYRQSQNDYGDLAYAAH